MFTGFTSPCNDIGRLALSVSTIFCSDSIFKMYRTWQCFFLFTVCKENGQIYWPPRISYRCFSI